MEILRKVIMVGFAVVAMSIVIGTSAMINRVYSDGLERRNELISQAEESTEAGYDVYLDGQAVDGKHIDFQNYRIKIDDENKAVNLSTINNNTTISSYPIIIR